MLNFLSCSRLTVLTISALILYEPLGYWSGRSRTPRHYINLKNKSRQATLISLIVLVMHRGKKNFTFLIVCSINIFNAETRKPHENN